MGNNRWEMLLKLALSMLIGTLVLLATADNPWDGDELFKGPAVGLFQYGGLSVFNRFMQS